MVSVLYVQYNALLTAFLVGEEWSRFACAHVGDSNLEKGRYDAIPSSRPLTLWSRVLATLGSCLSDDDELRVRKTLRVSAPEGLQRSSYFVSMPWRYGIPLISAMSLLHWLISQSVFVYAFDIYTSDGVLDTGYGLVVGTGFSLEAIICGESDIQLTTHLHLPSLHMLISGNDQPFL